VSFNNKLNDIKNKLEKESLSIESLIALACHFDGFFSPDELDNTIVQFHVGADQYIYIDDKDIGAVILQQSAFRSKDINLKNVY